METGITPSNRRRKPKCYFGKSSKFCQALKRHLVSNIPIERTFVSTISKSEERFIACLLHTTEGVIERVACQSYDLHDTTIQIIINDTGIPAGWFPLIIGYDAMPSPPTSHINLPSSPQELLDYLAIHARINPHDKELASAMFLKSCHNRGDGGKRSDAEGFCTS